jgi:hypothetical protein
MDNLGGADIVQDTLWFLKARVRTLERALRTLERALRHEVYRNHEHTAACSACEESDTALKEHGKKNT